MLSKLSDWRRNWLKSKIKTDLCLIGSDLKPITRLGNDVMLDIMPREETGEEQNSTCNDWDLLYH